MQTPAQEILAAIEGVDPNDTAKLDEIDARVHQYLKYPKSNPNILVYQGSADCKWDEVAALKNNPRIPIWKEYARHASRYTRSRDALKSIRPEGYYISDAGYHSHTQVYVCKIYKPVSRFCSDGWYVGESLISEELAELHAVIQAIEFLTAPRRGRCDE